MQLNALDQNPIDGSDALVCLPFQAALSNASFFNGSTAPTGAPLADTPPPYNEIYGKAALDPFGAGPICETFIDSCKYSTKQTRTYTAADGSEQSYPHSSLYNLGEDGECTLGDAATQWLDCGIPCPSPFPMTTDELSTKYGIGVLVFVGMCVLIGVSTVIRVSGKSANFFVAGRSLPLWIVIATLGSQSLDSNAALGNLDLGYNYHWWDGAVLPIGLGLSLVLNSIFCESLLPFTLSAAHSLPSALPPSPSDTPICPSPLFSP